MTVNDCLFAGKTVLVTGGGSGIGRPIAEAFLANDANVAISGRRRDELVAVFEGHPEQRTLAVEADVPTTSRPRRWSRRLSRGSAPSSRPISRR